MKLIIGNRAYSSWSMRGWLALKHAGFEFEELVVPLFDEVWEQRREGDEFAPSLGKVPILWDGDTVIWDSLAIIDYCADKVGRERFWPEDEAARGEVVVGVAGVDDVGGECDGIRRDALGGRHLGETDLGAQAGAMEVVEGPGELG